MADKSEWLFVYGTLKPGYRNHAAIERLVRSVQPGWIEGRLGMWGRVPGLVADEGRVRGVVLELQPEALPITDRIEDYRPGAADSLYVRRRIEAHIDTGNSIEAWTYYFGDPQMLTSDIRLATGDGSKGIAYEWQGGRSVGGSENPSGRGGDDVIR